jgi:hypothetical protein
MLQLHQVKGTGLYLRLSFLLMVNLAANTGVFKTAARL